MPIDGPNFRMDGRAALVTGAGRGIGLGIARALASAGCAIAIQDIEVEVARAEAERINRDGGRAVAVGGDVTDLAFPARAVGETVDRLGGLHVLVNNAAIQSTDHWLVQPPADMERQFRANVVVPILLCREAVSRFRPQRWGRIINVGSIQQRRGNPDMLAYSVGKSALNTSTRALARDLAPDGITVNLIAPGYFDTWRNRHDFADEQEKIEKGRRYVPLGRLGRPADAGGVALLLASEAGEYITGQTIYVDGGLSVKA